MSEQHHPSFWSVLSQDAARLGLTIDPTASLLTRLVQTRRAMTHKPSFACVAWLRVNQLFIRKGWPGQSRLYVWRQYRFANDISPYAVIGAGLFLPHPVDVTVGASAVIGDNVTLYNGVTLVGIKERPGFPKIGNNVTVYTGAKIIKPVTIGDHSVIGALSLCNKDVPAESVMYGIPPNVTIKPS